MGVMIARDLPIHRGDGVGLCCDAPLEYRGAKRRMSITRHHKNAYTSLLNDRQPNHVMKKALGHHDLVKRLHGRHTEQGLDRFRFLSE